MNTEDQPEPLCHALILPAPVHNPRTACGIEMSAAGLAAGHAQGTSVLGVRGPDSRITCAICQLTIGARPPSPPYEWDDVRVPTIRELSEEHGIAVTFPVDNAQVLVASYLDMLRTASAENFLLLTWSVDFGGDDRYAELRRKNPETEWDAIEVVTYIRKKSKPDPATLAARRLAEIGELKKRIAYLEECIEGKRRTLDGRAKMPNMVYTDIMRRPTSEHQRIMDEDHDRKVEAALAKGLELRGLCERVLSPADGADSLAADTALMAGDDGEWCPCAVARRTIDALNAERREGRREVERESVEWYAPGKSVEVMTPADIGTACILKARRERLNLSTEKVAAAIAKHAGVHADRLDAARYGGRGAFLEASLLALEDGTFVGDSGPWLAAAEAVLHGYESSIELLRIAQARDYAENHAFKAMVGALGDGWIAKVPDYVRDTWERGAVGDMAAALDRWHTEISAGVVS